LGKVLVAFIGSILILSSLGLSQGVFAQSIGAPSVPEEGLIFPSLEELDDPIAYPSFQRAGVDVDTNLLRNEPHIAVNPLNSQNVAVASVSSQMRFSLDGGATFPIVTNALIPATLFGQGYVFGGDPSLTFDSQGRFFWSYLVANQNDVSIVVLQVNPTTGATIGNAIDVTPGNISDDKNWMAADANPASPFADNLYIVWTRFPTPVTVMYSMSTNQGVTWTAPQAISITGTEGFTWPPHITVAPNGDVYATYPTNTCQTVGTVEVLRDTNGGAQLAAGAGFQKNAAFTGQQADITCNRQTFPPLIPQTDFWLQGSAAAYTLTDPTTPGRIYVIGNDDPNNIFGNGDDADVVMATSTDFGVNWVVSTISSGPANSFQVMPTGAIDEKGNICVSWYDNRGGQTNAANNFLLDVFVAFSTDGGATFTPDFQLNDVVFDPDLNAPTRFLGPPPTLRIGEYNGIAAANGVASAVWTGNDASSGAQEIFFDTFPCATMDVVGGEFLAIDSTALLLAGLQTSAIWMLPVLAGVTGSAFAILYIKSRRN